MIWTPIDEVFPVIEDMLSKNSDWTWEKNIHCKHIFISIDMEDGRCLIRNKNNEAISLEDLQYQAESESEDDDV